MVNYFELFGLPFGFSVNQADLRKKYLENSRDFHPDLTDDKEGTRSAEDRSSENNEGFRILKDFFETVRYILQLKGRMAEGEKETLDPAFLGEMMEINEGLMELEIDFDHDAFEKLRTEASDRLDAIENALRVETQRFDNEQDDSILDAIKTDYLKRKYLLRIKDSIDKFAAS